MAQASGSGVRKRCRKVAVVHFVMSMTSDRFPAVFRGLFVVSPGGIIGLGKISVRSKFRKQFQMGNEKIEVRDVENSKIADSLSVYRAV